MVLGTFVGWLSGAIAEVDEGILARMGIGLLGGLIGGLMAGLLVSGPIANLTLVGSLFAIVAAFILLGVVYSATRPDSRNQA